MNSIEIEYRCECGKVFKRKDNLNAHEKAVHKKIKVQCKGCNRFFHPTSLSRHMREKCGNGN